jgi:hypothetical protein
VTRSLRVPTPPAIPLYAVLRPVTAGRGNPWSSRVPQRTLRFPENRGGVAPTTRPTAQEVISPMQIAAYAGGAS